MGASDQPWKRHDSEPDDSGGARCNKVRVRRPSRSYTRGDTWVLNSLYREPLLCWDWDAFRCEDDGLYRHHATRIWYVACKSCSSRLNFHAKTVSLSLTHRHNFPQVAKESRLKEVYHDSYKAQPCVNTVDSGSDAEESDNEAEDS